MPASRKICIVFFTVPALGGFTMVNILAIEYKICGTTTQGMNMLFLTYVLKKKALPENDDRYLRDRSNST